MSVIGIDFGNESCYVAAAKAGGIETLANDYSLRATPSFVAFDGKKRVIGVAAKNQQVTNMKNTVCGFKRLLGRRFNDPHVQRELKSIPTQVEELANGGIGIRVNYLDKEQLFKPEQLTAMLFTKLKETSTHALQAQVNDCVIACPVYFTNAERRALLDAAHIAGLNVLRLMNETTATALSYGFYKQDLPEDKPRNVVFVDCGNASLQVSAAAFNKGKLKMLASTWDQIGGRDFDALLAEYFTKDFSDRYKINAKNNARAQLRLLTEIEKLKKQMSANSTKLPLNIECFMDDMDVSGSMQRSEMEELCAHLFSRVEQTFRRLLTESKLQPEEIHSVEIVGGSSRIPAIKQLIEQVFGKPASTTLNQDESVSRGAALQCAIMSPAVRVREFGVTDIQNYAVKVQWDGENNGGEIEVFPVFHAAPFSRLLTLNRREPFCMNVLYAQDVPYPDPVIGRWIIKDVKATERGEPQEVKVKVRINHHGIVMISGASLVEKKEGDEFPEISVGENVTTDEQQQAANNANDSADVTQEECNENEDDNNTTTTSSASSPGGQGWAQRVKGWFSSGVDKKKKTSKLIDLPMEVTTHGFAGEDLMNLVQMEANMIANDQKETERIDARNALEEYVYDLRNKLQGGPYERYVVEAERESICANLNDIENWLYEDGDDCDRDTYENKLKDLKNRTNSIKERAYNFEMVPDAFNELKHVINMARISVDEFRRGSTKYDHLTETDFLNVAESADKAAKWMEFNTGKFMSAPRTADSPVKLTEIQHEIDTLRMCLTTVINRPKPKPTPKQEKNAGGNGEHPSHNNEQAEEHAKKSETAKNNHTTDKGANFGNTVTDDSTMDVD